MYTISFTTPAEEDLIATLHYISDVLQSPLAAKSLLDELEQQIHVLADTPFIYSVVRDEYLGKKGIRYLLVKNYLVLYSVDEEDKSVTIIRIVYARRDWMTLLKKEL